MTITIGGTDKILK